MDAETVNLFWDFLDPSRLFGPICDKELRISSRRRRNYLLRSVYILFLAFLVWVIWLSVFGVRFPNSFFYYASRSSQIGRQVIFTIVWFQFIVSQILSITMLSASISDEIRTGTLNVLMTTPLNSFQIISGKLFGKLLQVFLLLMISLPLLAIIRIFGGIPWYYVVSGIFITLTAVIFAGSLSLFLSVFCRYAYHVIIIQFGLYLLIFGIIPGLIIWLATSEGYYQNTIHYSISYVNPFWAMAAATQQISTPLIKIFSWPIHCLIMFCISGVLLELSIWKVRYAALGNISVRHTKSKTRELMIDEKEKEITLYDAFPDVIKRVTGSPIVWKEKYKGLHGMSRTDKVVTTIIILLFVFMAFSFLLNFRTISVILTGITMSAIFLILMLRLAIATAGSIACEKEARTLPILLVTPLTNQDIIVGKVKVGIMRNIHLLVLYFFLMFFLYFSYGAIRAIIFPQAIFLIPIAGISVAGMVTFIAGCGAYIGVRMRSSTAAIAATVGVYFVVDFILGNLASVFTITLFTSIAGSNFITLYIIAATIMRVIILGGIGLYLLELSILRLRSNVF